MGKSSRPISKRKPTAPAPAPVPPDRVVQLELDLAALRAEVDELRLAMAIAAGRRSCNGCERLFTPRRRDQRYCSPACSMAAYRGRQRAAAAD